MPITCPTPISALKKSVSGERIWLKADGERCKPIRAQHDEQQSKGAVGGGNDAKPDRNARLRAPRGPSTGQQAHHQPEVVPGDMDQVSLVDVLPAAQPKPSHAAAIRVQRKPSLHQSAPEPD